MDIKEKLVELLDGMFNGECCVDKTEAADFLIAHGVTVQESDGCEYCNDPHPARDCVLPDGVEQMLVNYDDGTFLGKQLVYSRKIKFCPMCGRRFSQPPKGE